MGYEHKKYNGNVWAGARPKLSADLCCDGCDEKCKLSLVLQVKNQGYRPRKGAQRFVINPEVYAGDKKIYDMGVFASVKPFANEIVVDFDVRNAELIYQNALLWCRKTCKHSKLR